METWVASRRLRRAGKSPTIMRKLFSSTTRRKLSANGITSAASDELPRGFNLRDAADAADALAADRASNVWLIIAAICIFLTSIALSYAKIAKTDWDTRNPWHISIIEISFSMTLASIVPAVLFAAIVGAQSSAAPTYRILEAFKATRKEGKINDQQILECNVEANLSTGPVASWQYDRWPWISARQSEARMEAARRWFYRELLAVSPVTIVWFGATLLSSRVPPDGRMNCQTQYELVIGWIFLFNYLSGIALSTLLQAWERQLFWLTMTKDICATLAVILTILLTMVGGLNRQSCWASDDGNLLLLPDTTRLDLEDRIRREYPAIIFTSLALPLIICGLTAWLYRDGISVYLQLGVKLEDEGLLSRRRKVSPSQASTIETDQTLLRMPMEREKLGQVALRLAPLILVLAIVDSSDRGSGRVGPLFLFILNYALMFFSMWKLYSSHRARRESHRNARAELREALTSAQIPTQEIDDANRRIDVEAQCRDKQSQSLGWMRICGSLLWRVRSKNESGSGGSDDEDEKPKRPERDDTTGPEIIIPLCVNEGSDSLPRLIELEARNYPSDDLFFETLNNVVTKGRLSGWAGFLIWCGLRRVVGIHYVKV